MPIRLPLWVRTIFRKRQRANKAVIPPITVSKPRVAEQLKSAQQKHQAGVGREVRPLYSDPVYLKPLWKAADRAARAAERRYVESQFDQSLSPKAREEFRSQYRRVLKVAAIFHKIIGRHLTQDPKFEKALNPKAFEAKVYAYLRGKPKRAFSMATMDLDYFKKVNEKLGHDMADVLLETLVGVLHHRFKSNNIFFARVGGDEFRVFGELAPTLLANELQATALAIKTVVEGEEKFKGIVPTFSVGVAYRDGLSESENVADVFKSLSKKSDDGAYDAKGKGRNNIVIVKN